MHPFIAEQLVADRQAQALADAHHSRLVRAARATPPAAGRPPWAPRWRHRVLVGAIALVAATLAFAGEPAESSSGASTVRPGTEAPTLVGLRAAGSERVSYEPGASRTWSQGPRVVAVKVLSGRLTVYGTGGERRVYVGGERYAAGWAEHRTVNETDERVDTLVTNHVQP